MVVYAKFYSTKSKYNVIVFTFAAQKLPGTPCFTFTSNYKNNKEIIKTWPSTYSYVPTVQSQSRWLQR